MTFNIIEIHECRLKLDEAPVNSVQIPALNFEFTPTECNNVGTAIYIKND